MEILHGRLLGVDDGGTVRGAEPRGGAGTSHAPSGSGQQTGTGPIGARGGGRDLGEWNGVWWEPEGTGTEQCVRGEPQRVAGRRVFPEYPQRSCARLVSVFLQSYR